jgi:adenylosuccinate synthase
MGTLQIIVGGQYGSEAKGAIAGWLAREEWHTGGRRPMLAVRVAGPNAGHTVVDPVTKQPIALRQVPVAAVTNPRAHLAIGAGSEVDPAVVHAEIAELERRGISLDGRLHIDSTATWLTEDHAQAERDANIHARIGSTSKGIGAARADRVWRTAPLISEHAEIETTDTTARAYATLARGGLVQIEGAQGYALGQHAGHYPRCTSSDTRAVDFAAMAGISPWASCIAGLEVWVVFRTFPIRVAGDSGNMRNEIDWPSLSARIGRPVEERTTVTRLVRRVAEWDGDLARAALAANGAPSPNVRVALTFVDYIFPELAGLTMRDRPMRQHAGLRTYLQEKERDLGTPISIITTGPRLDDVSDLR